MGWKGTLRSLQAVSRRAERAAQRRRRELERQQKQLEKMQELERAAYEVEVYNNHIDLLLSVHKECSSPWNWARIQSSPPPMKPWEEHIHEESAQANLDRFKPSLLDKILRRAESKRSELEKAVDQARETDAKEYQKALQAYDQEYRDWESICELATKVLSGDPEAYSDAIRQANPFSDISELGASVTFRIQNGPLVEAVLHVQGENVIPSEVKSLLKSGKLSVKQMPKGKFYALYQDYICACVLRIAREIFALLPIEMVIVNATGRILNTQTGYMEIKPILSVAIPRETLKSLNIAMIDPSDSLSNFVHRMNFRKTKGFQAVEAIEPSELHDA